MIPLSCRQLSSPNKKDRKAAGLFIPLLSPRKLFRPRERGSEFLNDNTRQHSPQNQAIKTGNDRFREKKGIMCSAENIQYTCGHWDHEIRYTCAKGGSNPKHCTELNKSGARKGRGACDLCRRRASDGPAWYGSGSVTPAACERI